MAESFGLRLRQERERRQITLASIAGITKISPSLLEGLERDDVSHWPPGIFRRSFIRAYAQAIGLESDSVLREFLKRYPDPDEVVVAAIPAAPPGAGGQSVSERPPTTLRSFVSSAISSCPSFNLRIIQRLGSAIRSVTRARPAAARATPEPAPDLSAAAHLCTELARVLETREVPPLLKDAAKVLDAVGLVVWLSDRSGTELRPALAWGYSDKAIAQVCSMRRDAHNATATAFRSAQMCIVNGSDIATGAVVIPLITPSGCVGVLAAELRHGGAQRESVRALATIFAAQLARSATTS